MISGAILDAQLSASSSKLPSTTPERARPGQMGWCADYSDWNPYYQVHAHVNYATVLNF